MDEGDNPVSVGQARILRETPKAILVTLDGEEHWIPKSVIHDNSEIWQGEQEEGELVVKAWFARKEGWE